MKKAACIVVLSIFFVGCTNLSQPNVIDDKTELMALPENTADNTGTHNVSDAKNSGAAQAPDMFEVIEKPPSESFNPLYKITVSQEPVNIYGRNNNIYITSHELNEINLKALKQIETDNTAGSKLLVNKDNPLPENFIPQNLVNIDSGKVKLEYQELKLLPVTLKALYSMVEAAKEDGVKGFIINSAYRSLTTQQQIFDANLSGFKKSSKTYEEAYAKTRQLVALPGNSEHHTGLAADIFSVSGRHRNDFNGTKEQVWLNTNLQKYGFIIRYPQDKTKETNAVYEPWHIRYVGIPLSIYMKERNLCLEEFYSKIFSGEVLGDNESAFMGIKKTQQVFTDEELTSKVSLERINEDNALLTLQLG
ncbi:M15 family metallopeptidase [Ruminiclostridium cellobioparum]|uniref:M15 family metallopeptidase n=1 Tax=Ruminiclostridium cellobioparum TaxID=29355 RepID=UPI0028A72BD8|nr:M15 family metallopeptidase [Ruminiclostridium cellobioparum]